MSDRAHLFKILILIFLALSGYFIFKTLMKPESFGDWGHYRKKAINDEMSHPVVHQNQDVCIQCHDDVGEKHRKDVHGKIECHVCHGDGLNHASFYSGETENTTEEMARIPKNYTLEGCLYCHRKLSSRPFDFPQIETAEHFRMVGVVDNKTTCVECHSPHEPLYLKTKVSDSRLHPIVEECRHCHDKKPKRSHKEIPQHPVIFTCTDCHGTLAEDFETKPHAATRCTICHQSHPENENSERIFKNSNPKFCLLCHESKPFKDPTNPPKIILEKHARTHRVPVSNLNCIQCHMKHIHGKKNNPGGRPDGK